MSERFNTAALFLTAASLGLGACSQDDTERDQPARPDGEDEVRRVVGKDLGPGLSDGGADLRRAGDLDDSFDQEARDAGPRVPDQGCDTPGEILGCADDQSAIVCDAASGFFAAERCPDAQRCLTGIGCTAMVCAPQTQECDGAEAVKTCDQDGSGYGLKQPCPEGTLCSRGACVTQCELGKYRSSYVGCEYWTLDLDQYPDPTITPKPDTIPHSVVISNPSAQPATISFRASEPGLSINVPDPIVAPGASKAFTMPRLDVSGTGISRRSIKIESSVPVTAHQFSPLNDEGVFSNDASLLLPSNTLGVEYYVVGWPTGVIPPLLGNFADQHAYFTIVATSQGSTALNVTPRAQIAAGADGKYAIAPGSTRSFTLEYGDVLNLEVNSGSVTGANDPTGTYISATQPIAVFTGHEQAVVKDPKNDLESCCADHIEQQLFPLKDWGTRYIAALSPGRGDKADHWRVVSGEDGVTLKTDPPQPGAHDVTLNKGDFVAFFSKQSFEINATGKVLVGQLLVSQQQTSQVTGDPALILAVPVERFRSDYILLTPSGYASDFVLITRQAGERVELNGQAVTEAMFQPIGSGAYEVAEVSVSAGVQTLEGSAPFGIAAYGFDSAVSYGYPGGLNLIGQELNP